MATLMHLNTRSDHRGSLSILEDSEIPFSIRRLFYIYDLGEYSRGGHRHKRTEHALICINGICSVLVNNGRKLETFLLDAPSTCLLLEPDDWHLMYGFAPGTILLACASELYDPEDYITEPLSNLQEI